MAGSLRQPQKQATRGTTLPAPNGGMNTTGSLYGMPVTECIYCWNIMPSEFGMRTRLGYRERSTIALGTGVRTIIPYDGREPNQVADRLFASTSDGIYDCTVPGAAVKVQDFPNKAGEAGYGHFTHYVNDNGDSFLLAAFSDNGLFEYDPALDTWSPSANIDFPVGDPRTVEDIEFVMSHKQRLWVVCKGDTAGYYLPIGSKQGQLTKFEFGNKFKYGGELVGLYNWTLDGGEGVDDYLLAISGGGDIIMFKGEDPSAVDSWRTTGTWFIGEVPEGRRCCVEQGGNVWILSSTGVLRASDLVRGVDDPNTDPGNPAFKISRLIRDRMYQEKDTRGWEIILNANEAQIVINSPPRPAQGETQYVYNIPVSGWGLWRDVPMNCCDSWNGRFFIGTLDNKVFEMVGGVDNVPLDPEDGGEKSIEFSVLGTFQDYGEAATFKRVQFMRPVFLADAAPDYQIVPRYDFDISEPNLVSTPQVGGPGEWDIDSWDLAVWGGGINAYESIRGGGGLGRTIAFAIRGDCTSRVTLAAIDIMWDTGGLL